MAPREFAPGLPVKGKISAIPGVAKPTTWELIVQHHPAARAGDHYDIRLINPASGIAHSWATKKETPTPGGKIRLFQQSDHDPHYCRTFSGAITEGYGRTKPGSKGVQKVLHAPIEVLQADDDLVRFNVYEGGPREFVMARRTGPGKGAPEWTLINVTKTRDSAQLPEGKPQYKETPVGALDFSDPRTVLSAKLDGAHVLLDLQGGKRPRVYSYRVPKHGDTGLIEHTHKLDLYHSEVPKDFGDTLLRGEVYARAKDGKSPVPAETVGGMLNASVLKSRAMQEQHGKLRPALFDVVRFKGKDYTGATYRQKLEVLREVAKAMPGFELPDMAFSEAEKRVLFEAIEKGTHPATREGLVAWHLDEPAAPVKSKLLSDHDVYVTGVNQLIDNKGKPRAEMGSLSYAWDPSGDTVGQVGTGFTKAQREKIWKDKGLYANAVMKVRAQAKYPSGALGKPVFAGWHLDKQTAPGFWEKAAARYGGSKVAEIPLLSREKKQALRQVDTFFKAEPGPEKWDQFLVDLGRKSFVAALKGDPRADEKLKRHADAMNRLATGKVLGEMKGQLGTYSIVRLRGGGLGCTCNDWRFKRSVAPEGERECKHIRGWKAKKG